MKRLWKSIGVAGLALLGMGMAQNTQLSGDLTIWGWKGALDGLKILNEDFAKAYPNIKLSFVQRPAGENYQQLQLAVAAGSGGPDVTVVEDSILQRFIGLDAFADLTERIGPLARSLNRFKLSMASSGGKIYAMPWDSGPVALYYRRDIFQKAGVDAASIKTWDDYYKAAVTIKAKTGVRMMALAKARNDGRMFETFMWQQGVGYINGQGAVVLDRDPRTLRTLEYFGRLFKEDLVADVENWSDPFYKAIAEGEVATLPMAVWMGGFLKSWLAPKTSGLWGVIPLPNFSGQVTRASSDGGSALAIMEQSKNKDLAWAYVQFVLARPESQLKMYKTLDLFPALETTYTDALFKEPDPYFGNQNVRQLFVQVVKNVPQSGIYTADYPEMNSLFATELQKFAVGQQTAQQTLRNAANKIRERTRRK